MVKIKVSAESRNDAPILWDNEELVMRALKVYGKHPRPQCFKEIARVCNLSNIRKSRYFHEKMMRNNPFKDKIHDLLAAEGDHSYPYFKIFFEEYKTRKERSKLIKIEANRQNISNDPIKNEGSLATSNDDVDSYDQSTRGESYNDDHYQNGISNDEISSYGQSTSSYADDKNHNDIIDEEYNVTIDNSEYCQEEYINVYDDDEEVRLQPLNQASSNRKSYLENLKLKIQVMNKEKEAMQNYFQTFAGVMENLENQIKKARANGGRLENSLPENDSNLNQNDLKNTNIEKLPSKLFMFKECLKRQKENDINFGNEQKKFKEDLYVTKKLAITKNEKLQGNLNNCKATLSMKDQEIADLKQRLDVANKNNKMFTLRNLAVQQQAGLSRAKMLEMKDSMSQLFNSINF